MQRTVFIILVSVIFSACVKDKPEELQPTVVNLSNDKKVYIVNEGNFGSGNASYSLYDVASNTLIEDLYFTQNAASVGDVAQSLIYINDRYYLVINNSGKVIVCDDQFKKTGQINGLPSPRYLLGVTNQKAYVSDLYANAISIVDLNSKLKTGSIVCPGKTEQMVMIYNKVFVCNTDKFYVYVINAANDQIEDSVYVGLGASSLVLDRQDKIWVLASGNQTNSSGRLSKINALNNQIEFYQEFTLANSPWNLRINGSKDTLFYIDSHIYKMAVSEMALPLNPIIERGSKNFYGLGIHPHNFTIYAADAIDYSQRSNIYIYNANGTQLNLVKAGINSNGFYFE